MNEPAPRGLSDFVAWWLERVVRPRVKRRTYEHYVWATSRLAPHFGARDTSAISPLDVEAWMARLRASGLSGQSVFLCRSALRRLMRDAIRYGLREDNPAAAALPPSRAEFVVIPLTPAEAKVLLRSSRGTRWEPLFAVALALGMRRGELLGLRWSDVDLERAILTLRYQLQWYDDDPEPVWERPKGKKRERRIYMPEPIVQRLREHRVRQQTERLRAGDHWQDYDLVFCRTDGRPYRGDTFRRALHAALAAAGLPRKRFHDLRHSCASLLIAMDVPLVTIQELLGHADFAFTKNVYGHLYDTIGKEAAEKMATLMEDTDA